MPVRKRGKPLVLTPFQRQMRKEAIIYRELSEKLYSPTNLHADPVSGEFYRLKANAFGELMEGQSLDIVLMRFKSKWLEFCKEQNQRVAEAPKIKTGPMSGHSSIHHRYAFPGRFDDAAIHIRNAIDFAQRAEAMGLKK